MDRYKRYFGVVVFLLLLGLIALLCFSQIAPKFTETMQLESTLKTKTQEVEQLQGKLRIVQNKIKQIKDSIVSSQKKIFAPEEDDLGNDTIFFTMYNDVIEMLHANSIKIRSMEQVPNPEGDAFVQFGKGVYFVCDINMELISNYVNLGKLIQDIYQYPYYIRINELEVTPYAKDKKVLISKLSLRLYAHTAPVEESTSEVGVDAPALDGADVALPQ